MAQENVKPLWSLYKTLNTREPQYYEPMIWPWETMSKLVDRSAREVDMAEAERRALLFAHPGFPGTVFTTPTLSGALQVLEPGESAHAHRHTLAALRLAMTGEGHETVTDGKACPMEPGDLILTPAWTLARASPQRQDARGLVRRARLPARACDRHRVLRERPGPDPASAAWPA